MGIQVSLDAWTLQRVQIYFNKGKQFADKPSNIGKPNKYYMLAYREIAIKIHNDVDLKYWFEKAALINGEGNSNERRFVWEINKASTLGANDQKNQAISNGIAERVLADVLSKGGVPTLPEILRKDIAVAFNDKGSLTAYDYAKWSGSAYYWNIKINEYDTIGDILTRTPQARMEFEDNLAKAVAATAMSDPVQGVADGYSVGKMLFNLPSNVRNNIIRKAGGEVKYIFEHLFGSIENTQYASLDTSGILVKKTSGLMAISDNPDVLGLQMQVFDYIANTYNTINRYGKYSQKNLSIAIGRVLLNGPPELIALYPELKRSISIGEIASLFGSTLGNQISGSNKATSFVSGVLLGTVAFNIGQSIAIQKVVNSVYGNNNTSPEATEIISNKTEIVWGDFGLDLAKFGTSAAIGSISSYLTAELVSSIGLNGFGAELFGTVSSTLLQHTITNFASGIQALNGLELKKEVWFGKDAAKGAASGAMLNAIGSFLGAKLGSLIVQPQTQAGAVLGSLGSSLGTAWAISSALTATTSSALVTVAASAGASTQLTALGNLIVPGIGAFVGFVIGTLIGNLFGKKKPRVPSAYANIEVLGGNNLVTLTGSGVSGGGNLELAQYMARTALETLNGLVDTVSQGQKQKSPWGGYSLTSQFGHDNNQLWVKLGGSWASKTNVSSADEAVDKMVLWSLNMLNIRGGNMFVKRAIKRTKATSIAVLSGDIQIADDYGFYLQNRSVIDAAIAEPYTSMKLITADYLLWVRNNPTYFNEYKADTTNEDPNGVDLAKIRAWGEQKSKGLGLDLVNSTYQVSAGVDSNFYDANKSFMTRAMAKDSVALNATDQAFYNANKTQVDRIISRLALTQFAASWIITLQRAAELEINRASSTDFIGGAGGFADSLKLMSGSGDNSAFYDYIRFQIRPDGTTLRASYLDGGTNKIRGADLSDGVSIAKEYNQLSPGDFAKSIENIDGEVALVLSKTANYQNWGVTAAGSVMINGGDRDGYLYSVKPGENIGISFDTKTYQTDGRTDFKAHFYDVNGNYMSTQWGGSSDTNNRNWQTLKLACSVPSNSYYVAIEVFVVSAGSHTGQLQKNALRHFQLESLPSGATVSDIPAWSGSSYSNFDLSNFYGDVGYTNSWANEDRSKNNFIDTRNNSAAQNLVDSATTTTTVDDYQWQYNGWDYDEVWVGSHEETVESTGGNDIFLTGAGADTLDGRAGDDWLDAGAGNDRISGGDGDDVLLGREGKDGIVGGAGDDYISLGAGDDYADWVDPLNGGAWGGDGNDTIVGGAGQDSMMGEGGDDTFIVDEDGGATWDWYDGGSGSNTLSFIMKSSGLALFDLQPRAGWTWSPEARLFYGDGFQNIQNITGTNYDDTIYGDEIANVLKGGYGDDKLYGRAGDDTLEGGAGADVLDGNEGNDGVSYKDSQSAVWVDLTATADNNYAGEGFGGDAEGDTYFNIEHITGSDLADTLKGTAGYGLIWGGKGDDWVIATNGGDGYDGGDGFDTIDFSEVGAAVYADLNNHGANWSGGAINLINFEHLYGSNYNDTFYGTTADETFTGLKGNDFLSGGNGNDTYIFNKGDGFDTINEEFAGSNSIVFGEGVTWSDLTFQTVYNGQSQALWLSIRGTSEGLVVYSNFTSSYTPNNKIKSLDVGGAGAVDLTKINHGLAGGTGNDLVYGKTNTNDWQWGYEGNDTIWGAASQTAYEQNDNIIVGGQGNDAIYTSVGDDTFIFERGHGQDTIYDSGGIDRIVIGSTATMDDVIYEVVGNDLYVGLKDTNNTALTASQVADRMRIVNGGYKYVDYEWGTPTGNETFSANLVEHVAAGGAEIDFKKLDVNWTEITRDVTNYGGDGGYYNVPPVVFDLGGDGADLISHESSPIAFQSDVNGMIYQMGWVSGDDGILALDRDGDGAITKLSEISFTSDLEGAKTDLEGLRAYDSNKDGVLDAKDEKFGNFLIWRDINQNGRGRGAELQTLAQIGITSINLNLTPTGYTPSFDTGNVIINTADFTWADGSTGTANDVALRVQLANLNGPELGGIGNTSWYAPSGDGELGRVKTKGKKALEKITLKAGEKFTGQNLELVRADAGDGSQALKKVIKKKHTFADLAEAQSGGNVSSSAGSGAPIVIDMGGDGIELINAAQSNVWSDLNEDGFADKIGWIGGGDAFLAIDRDGDGLVQALSEVSFLEDLPGAKTDLEGLRAYDSNGDSWLDSNDAKFSSFLIWQDTNQDGVSSYDEIYSLDEAGIEKIGLFYKSSNNVVSAAGLTGETSVKADLSEAADNTASFEGDTITRAYLNDIDNVESTAASAIAAKVYNSDNQVFGHMEVHFKAGRVVDAADVAFGSINGASINPFETVDEINKIAADDEYEALNFGNSWSMTPSKRKDLMKSLSGNNDTSEGDTSDYKDGSSSGVSGFDAGNALTTGIQASSSASSGYEGLSVNIEPIGDVFTGNNANHSLSGLGDWLADETTAVAGNNSNGNTRRWWLDEANGLATIGSKTLAQTLSNSADVEPEASALNKAPGKATGSLLSSAEEASMRRNQAFTQAIVQFRAGSAMAELNNNKPNSLAHQSTLASNAYNKDKLTNFA